jgi:hypothetical protein
VGYELGVAVGKLRRLKDLALDLSEDGRAYHAVAQGLAASGGDRPLPLLWRVRGCLKSRGQCRPAGEPAPPECAGLQSRSTSRQPSGPPDGMCSAPSGVQFDPAADRRPPSLCGSSSLLDLVAEPRRGEMYYTRRGTIWWCLGGARIAHAAP